MREKKSNEERRREEKRGEGRRREKERGEERRREKKTENERVRVGGGREGGMREGREVITSDIVELTDLSIIVFLCNGTMVKVVWWRSQQEVNDQGSTPAAPAAPLPPPTSGFISSCLLSFSFLPLPVLSHMYCQSSAQHAQRQRSPRAPASK
eukprot:765609-Hanusia_phi.AAC.3